MANIKELILSIEAVDSSFDEKLAAINQMEETLVAMRQQEEQAVQDNVDLIVEAIRVMERKVENQLEIAKSIVPEKGDKGDKGDRGLDGANGRDGKDGRDGVNGRDGQDGKDGVSVTDAKIDFDGSLVITLSTGQEINVGEVVTPDLQEKIKLVTSGGAGTVLPSQTGNANKYLKTDGTSLSWATASGGSGTVTSVGGTGTVSGISLSGTVTTSGNLTLGGALDLSSPPAIGSTAASTGAFTTLSASSTVSGTGFSTYLASPPAIGGTTPAAGKFTTLESTGTASLGTGSTTSIQIVGDASYPQIKAVGGTNTPLVLQPLGTGALQAQKTDSTATGGNARGTNATDWQTSRNAATQVASGIQTTIGGGINNTASGTVATVAGGTGNAASQAYASILGGISNSAAGYGGVVCGGYTNQASGYFSFIGTGYTNSGTATAAVTTQSGTMNATTAVTLSGSNASIKVGQLITGTSITTFPATYVAAISGTALTLSQVASGSTTNTLSFYTPHGIVVGGGNNQATGAYSFIGGGGDAGTAANRNTASGDWATIVGGYSNTAAGNQAFVGGGFSNSAGAGQATVSGGSSNNITGQLASIIGGNLNTASALLSSVLGGQRGTTRAIVGNAVIPAHASPFGAGGGLIQSAILLLGRQTTDATATVITSDTNAASATNQIALPINSAYFFKGEVIAGVTAAGDTKGWSIEGVIKRATTAASTALVGTPTVTSLYADAGAATWSVAVAADTTNAALKITVTGAASTTIRWVAQIRTTEMTF